MITRIPTLPQQTVKTTEAGKAVVAQVAGVALDRRSSQFHELMSLMEHKEFNFKTYEDMYLRLSVVNRGINTMADMVMQGDLRLQMPKHLRHLQQPPSDALKRNLKFIGGWMRYIGFSKWLLQETKYALIYGSSFTEIVEDPQSPWRVTELKSINPTQMWVVRDPYGEVWGYIQHPPAVPWSEKYNRRFTKDSIPKGMIWFEPEEILHIKWNPLPSKAYGLSMIECLKGSLTLLMGMLEDAGIIARSFAGPLLHFKVGTETMTPTDDAMEEVRTAIEDQLLASSNLITNSMVDATVIGPGQSIMDLDKYIELSLAMVLLGMGIPEVLMGRGQQTTEATANVQRESFDRLIKSIQGYLRHKIEIHLFPRLCGVRGVPTPDQLDSIPSLFWEEIETVEEKRLRSENGFRFGAITRNEYRAILGFGPVTEEQFVLDQDADFQRDIELLRAQKSQGGPGSPTGATPKGPPTQKPSDRDAEFGKKGIPAPT